MGTFERFLSLWVALAIAGGVGLGLVAPGLFEIVPGFEWAGVNLVVAALIWLMIYPMMLKVEPSCLKDVGKKPKGLALVAFANRTQGWFPPDFLSFRLEPPGSSPRLSTTYPLH